MENPQYDPNDDLPGTLAYRLSGHSDAVADGVWIDGEFVGLGKCIEIRSADVEDFDELLSVEERAANYVRRLERERDKRDGVPTVHSHNPEGGDPEVDE